MRMRQLLAAGLVLGAVGLGAPSALAAGAKACPDGDCRKDAPGWGIPDSGVGIVAADTAPLYDGPGKAFTSIGSMKKDEHFIIVCQAPGDAVSGPRAQNSPLWDKISGPPSAWVADAEVDSGPQQRAARGCRGDEVPTANQCAPGARVSRAIYLKAPGGAPASPAARFTWTPQLCRKAGQWEATSAPVVQIPEGPATGANMRLELEAPRQFPDGVEYDGKLLTCLSTSTGVSASIPKVGGGVSESESHTDCDVVGTLSVQATVTSDVHNPVSYRWDVQRTPRYRDLGVKLEWRDS